MEGLERAGVVEVGDGRVATLVRCRAPVPRERGMALTWFLEGAFGAEDKPDMFVTPTAKGMLERTARNDFAWAEVDGDVIATAWMTTPADDPRIGTFGEVFTDPDWRRRGLAQAVCGALLERFDADGGRVLYLGTSDPGAARIYGRLGFVPHPRGLMRRDATDDQGSLDGEWFTPSPVTIRPLTWGDTPRVVALYAAPNPWLSACWMQGLYSASHVTHDRCNSLMKNTWQATRSGAWLGLVNATGALVGSLPMEPRGNEQAAVGADIDVFIHPAFQHEAPGLLDAMVAEAARHGWRWLRAELGEGDAAKCQILEGVGFREVGRMDEALEIGGVRQAVAVLRLDVSNRP